MALSGKRLFAHVSRGRVAGRLAVVVIVGLALGWLATAGPFGSQGRAQASAATGPDAQKHFTIVKVEPDAGARRGQNLVQSTSGPGEPPRQSAAAAPGQDRLEPQHPEPHRGPDLAGGFPVWRRLPHQPAGHPEAGK